MNHAWRNKELIADYVSQCRGFSALKRPGNEPIRTGRKTVQMRPKVKNVPAEWLWLGLFRGEIKGVGCGASVTRS